MSEVCFPVLLNSFSTLNHLPVSLKIPKNLGGRFRHPPITFNERRRLWQFSVLPYYFRHLAEQDSPWQILPLHQPSLLSQ